MADSLETIKISELPLATSYGNLVTIGVDADNKSVKVPVGALVNPPKIGSDGYWYIWSIASSAYVKTSYVARGEKGDAFTYEDFTADQLAALKGKSAYELAKEGGYTGTEAEYAAMLAGLDSKHVLLTEAEYEALATKDSSKIYMTYEDE